MENVNYKFAGIDVGFYNEYYSNSIVAQFQDKNLRFL